MWVAPQRAETKTRRAASTFIHHPSSLILCFMKVVRSFTELAAFADKVCIAIGVFDGVHLGHQSVIRAALDDAEAVNGAAVVLTFDPHPIRVLAPAKAPPLLT